MNYLIVFETDIIYFLAGPLPGSKDAADTGDVL
jgi:hypothetical protein